MSINISYSKKQVNNTSSNLILFTNEKFYLGDLKKSLINSEFLYVEDLLKSSDLKKSLLVFEVNSKKKIILISIKKDLKNSDFENLGAELFKNINYGKKSEYFLNTDTVNNKHKNFLSHFLHGLKLKSYEFKKYKTKKDTRIITINIVETKINLQLKIN